MPNCKCFSFRALSLSAVLFAASALAADDAKSDPKPAPQPVAKDDPAAALVRQLDAPDFKTRQEAAKKLRDLGAKAIPALQAGTRGQSLEATRRSQEVLAAVRADLRDALAKQFDPKKKTEYDHPVWKRFVVIAGDSRASRELFARIIANEKWLRTLDNADADPALAGHVYRVGIAEVFRDFDRDPAKSPPWPCDRPEEVAYLLLLGSYPDNNPPAKLTGDEVVPTNLRGGVEFLGRGIIFGEGQITHANGLSLGLDGKIRFFNAPEIVGAVGTDRVFARLFAAWLVRRDPGAEFVPLCFRIASQRVPEILPLARRFAANDFKPNREVPPKATIAALELVAQHGARADLPLFERHFGDETNVAAVDKPRADGARDYYRPAPVTETTQLRDVALGLALLLHGASPEDFGFVVRKDTFKEKDGRYTIPWSTQLHLGFESEASRTATFKKAKAWLVEQKPKVEPPPAQKGKDAEKPAKKEDQKDVKPKADAGGPVHSLPGHTDRLTSVAYSADGKSIATSSWDGTVRIWDAKTGKEERRMESDTKLHTRFNQIVFSPDNAFIVTSVRDSTGAWVAVVWNRRTGEKVRTLPAEAGSVAVSPDGSLIACGGYRIIRLYEFATGKLVREMHDKDEKQLRMQSLIFSSDGKSLVSTGHAPTPPREGAALGPAANDPEVIRVWDVASGKVRPSALNGLFVVPFGRKLALSPDGRSLVLRSGNGLSLLEAATRGERAKLTGHKAGVSDFAFLPDGRTLASAGVDGTVRLWDLRSGKEIGRFGKEVDLSKGWVVAVAFSPDGRSLVSGGLDKKAHIWDVSKITGRPRTSAERSPADLEADWKDIGGDAAKGYAAIGRLISSPKQAVSFLGKQLQSAKPADTKRIERLISDLDDARFQVREAAAKELTALGEFAVPLVQKALAGSTSLEVRRRMDALLERLEGASLSVETVRQIRAVEALESIGNPEALRLLDKLATGPSEMRLTQEAMASARRLAKRSSGGP